MASVNKIVSRETTLQMVLMIAACFAIGSTGLLIAVLMSSGSQAVPPVMKPLPSDQEKTVIVQSLNATESSQPIDANATSTATGVIPDPGSSVPKSNLGEEQKLKIIEALNHQ